MQPLIVVNFKTYESAQGAGALALAEAKGDQLRCSQLRDRIADLGGNAEEPGT